MLWRGKSGKDKSDNESGNKVTNPAQDAVREEVLQQSEEARKVYEDIQDLRKSIDTLKEQGTEAAQKALQDDPAPAEAAGADYADEAENAAAIHAAQEAILAKAKEDEEKERQRREEARRRELLLQQEQQRVIEAQRKAARISEEAERKRIEAMEAEKNAREVARRKAFEAMEAERREREERLAAEQAENRKSGASPEEMAEFFSEQGGDERETEAEAQQQAIEELTELQRKALAEQQYRLRLQQLRIEQEKARAENIVRRRQARARARAEAQQARARERAQALIDKQERDKMKTATREERAKFKTDFKEKHRQQVRAERLAKVERKRAERARKAEERERIRKERRRLAKEVARLKAQARADAAMGGGIVNVKGVKVSTEINRRPSFALKDLFGIITPNEKKRAQSPEEQEALKAEAEERKEQARAAAELISKQRIQAYENSRFGQRMTKIKNYCEAHKKTLLMGLAAFTMAIVSLAGVFNYCTAYEYSYNGQKLGYVKEKDEVLRITDLVQSALTEEKNVNVVIDAKDDISFKRKLLIGRNREVDTSEQVLKRLTYMGDLNIKAYGIYVNGEKVGAVQDKETAEAVLEDIKDKYAVDYNDENIESRDVEIESVQIVEDVEGKKCNTNLEDLYSEEEMVDILCTSGTQQKLHKVVAGDTLNSISKLYSVSEDKILEDNANVNSERLEVGSTIVINQTAPLLTVKVTQRVTYDKVIEHEVEEKKSADIYEGYTETEQEGTDGLSEVTARITTVNGEKTDEKELKSTTKTDPVKEVVLVGTKERPATVGSGKYEWPLKDSFTQTTGFEMRWGSFHQGIDLACSQGTSIYAADGGTVIQAGYSGTYGNLVVIDHQNGQETRYAHCSELLVSEGDKVFQGQEIAKVGSTGRSTGPHLHFEIRVDDTPENPLDYLP